MHEILILSSHSPKDWSLYTRAAHSVQIAAERALGTQGSVPDTTRGAVVDNGSPLGFHIQFQNKCHENFTDIRVSFQSRGGERFRHPREENRVFTEEGTLKARSCTLRLLCSIPRGGSCWPVIYFSLSFVTGRQGGGGLLNGGESVHLPCMAVGGFFFVPLFFSCLFNVYFFPLAFRTQ